MFLPSRVLTARALTPPPSFASGGEGKLSTLPRELFDIPTLTELNCIDCGADRPPEEVQRQGVLAMRYWWADPEAERLLQEKLQEKLQSVKAEEEKLQSRKAEDPFLSSWSTADVAAAAKAPSVCLDADFADSVPDDDAFIGDMGIKALKGFIEKAGLSHADW